MYTTVAELATGYGVDELFQLLVDEQPLLTRQLVQDKLDNALPGDYTAEQLAAVDAAFARCDAVIEQQGYLMDSYFARRYSVPLAGDALTKNPVADCCRALTRAALADDANNRTETMAKTQERWLKWLEQIAKGTAVLVGVAITDDTPGEPTREYKTTALPSGIDWGSYP